MLSYSLANASNLELDPSANTPLLRPVIVELLEAKKLMPTDAELNNPLRARVIEELAKFDLDSAKNLSPGVVDLLEVPFYKENYLAGNFLLLSLNISSAQAKLLSEPCVIFLLKKKIIFFSAALHLTANEVALIRHPYYFNLIIHMHRLPRPVSYKEDEDAANNYVGEEVLDPWGGKFTHIVPYPYNYNHFLGLVESIPTNKLNVLLHEKILELQKLEIITIYEACEFPWYFCAFLDNFALYPKIKDKTIPLKLFFSCTESRLKFLTHDTISTALITQAFKLEKDFHILSLPAETLAKIISLVKHTKLQFRRDENLLKKHPDIICLIIDLIYANQINLVDDANLFMNPDEILLPILNLIQAKIYHPGNGLLLPQQCKKLADPIIYPLLLEKKISLGQVLQLGELTTKKFTENDNFFEIFSTIENDGNGHFIPLTVWGYVLGGNFYGIFSQNVNFNQARPYHIQHIAYALDVISKEEGLDPQDLLVASLKKFLQTLQPCIAEQLKSFSPFFWQFNCILPAPNKPISNAEFLHAFVKAILWAKIAFVHSTSDAVKTFCQGFLDVANACPPTLLAQLDEPRMTAGMNLC